MQNDTASVDVIVITTIAREFQFWEKRKRQITSEIALGTNTLNDDIVLNCAIGFTFTVENRRQKFRYSQQFLLTPVFVSVRYIFFFVPSKSFV